MTSEVPDKVIDIVQNQIAAESQLLRSSEAKVERDRPMPSPNSPNSADRRQPPRNGLMKIRMAGEEFGAKAASLLSLLPGLQLNFFRVSRGPRQLSSPAVQISYLSQTFVQQPLINIHQQRYANIANRVWVKKI